MSFQSIPLVDISPFVREASLKQQGLPADSLEDDKLKVARELHTACKEVGFFYISGHGLSEEWVSESFNIAKKFFELPAQEKNKLSLLENGHFRGFQPIGENVTKSKRDWHEAIDFYREVDPVAEPSHPFKGDNLWPENPQDFKPYFLEYIEKMQELGRTVMSIMALGLGLAQDHFEKYCSKSFWVMRIIGYPPLQEALKRAGCETTGHGISCGEHTDYGCLTILNQDSTRGALKVKNVNGEWIDANPIPGAFVMNLGDMIKIWTNGLYQSTPHRVINSSDNFRISVPFFYEPNFDAVIEPLQGREESKPDAKPIVYGDHLVSKVSKNFAFQLDEKKP